MFTALPVPQCMLCSSVSANLPYSSADGKSPWPQRHRGLGRVIYALNTKNDEHEANIQALKDAHEEEIQHIRAETRKTILQYKSKAEEEKSLRKRIQVLEDAVDQHRRLKEEALAELTLFKKQVKELRMEVKQAEILSTDTGDTNADFEDRLLHLNQQHEGLLNECKALREIFDTKEILDKKHSVEEQALIKEMENQKSENQSVTEECTQKSSQLQDSCEREKETLQQAIQQSMAEQQKNCQQRELEPRKSLEAQEVFLLQQVKKLEVDLEEKTWKVNERKKHSQKMKERIQLKMYNERKERAKSKDRTRNSCKRQVRCSLMSLRNISHVTHTRNSTSYLCYLNCKFCHYGMDGSYIEFSERMNELMNKRQSHEEKIHLKEQLVKVLEDLVMEHSKEIKSEAIEGRDAGTLSDVLILHICTDAEYSTERAQKRALLFRFYSWRDEGSEREEKTKVAQLKQMLEQQASNFKESLKKQNLQAIKEKEKLLQDLQNTIKENQNVKLQLEASHQKILKMLEKSKNRELKAEERLKREFNESFKTQHHSHKLEIETLEERAKKELHDELEEIQKEQTLLLGSVRLELSEQQALCTSLRKQIAELQEELHRVRTLRKHQASSYLTVTLLIEDLQVKHSKELDALKQDHQKEMENVLCDFSSTQAHLQAKIFSLETELKELEEKSRKQEARAEDKHLVSCLQDKIREREEIIKQLVEGRKFQHSLLANTESYRSRSFSFNPSLGCLTPSMKQKKVDEGPSRVISVPNLASYAKSFLSCDLRPRRSASQVPKSTSLEQSSPASRAPRRAELPPGTGPFAVTRQSQEWFAKYFSF
uniref:Family with sequence similarity 184 member B n=1 Tax=Nothoprocta perdicaria TaxID=30464 RepID=A0A8C6YPJ0_NOTPE